MEKPVFYLWKQDFSNEKEYKETLLLLENCGFRVVTLVVTDEQQEPSL